MPFSAFLKLIYICKTKGYILILDQSYWIFRRISNLKVQFLIKASGSQGGHVGFLLDFHPSGPGSTPARCNPKINLNHLVCLYNMTTSSREMSAGGP